ncbi:MAG: nucleotidyltransferase domain-containing protein [Candidatus Lokiarchaeota archaeon]
MKSRKIKEILKEHPKWENLTKFLQNFYSNYSAEFILLFGSSAKGNFNYKSDIDLLIVSNSIEGNYFEKLKKMFDISPGGIDLYIYSLEDFDRMVREFHSITLEALSEGILLYDKGFGETYKKLNDYSF